MRSLYCTSCGADITIEDDNRDFAFCQYCGTKIMLDDYRVTQRIVDEAKLKQAETEQMIKLKQLEFAEKQNAANEKKSLQKRKICFAAGIVGLLLSLIGVIAGNTSGDSNSPLYFFVMIGMLMMGWSAVSLFDGSKKVDETILDGKVSVPTGVYNFEKKSYVAIKAAFEGAGFKNIQCIPLNDLAIGVMKKPGMVESIVIGGKNHVDDDERLSPDISVVISYHSFPTK